MGIDRIWRGTSRAGVVTTLRQPSAVVEADRGGPRLQKRLYRKPSRFPPIPNNQNQSVSADRSLVRKTLGNRICKTGCKMMQSI
jgi:hypothetical protein